MDQSQPSIAEFLDLAKPFDTVDHQRLLKASTDGIVRGSVLNLFKRRKEHSSSVKNVKFGILYGTVIDPISFNKYINALLSLLIMTYNFYLYSLSLEHKIHHN